MDQYPYREDGRDAVNESVQWMLALERVVERMDEAQVEQIIHAGDAVAANRMLRTVMFG
jgi:xylose isomerase